MEHEVRAASDGVVEALRHDVGDVVEAGVVLAPCARPAHVAGRRAAPTPRRSTRDALRADLLELRAREALLADASRPDAVAKRHALGLRTARENIADLCDAGSFVEYGALAFAAQRSRRELDDLIRNTPADGMVTGIGSVNASAFGAERSRAVVMAYDATVLAGTQGMRNHQKTDRMLGIAREQRLPVVLFAEGGGGRPGDTDMPIVAGLHVTTFASFARLSGQVPVVGIVAGRCFAGNAALLGCCDVIIATRDSTIGMGGPAMVEGGGLGVFRPEQIGPSDVQSRTGVIDVLVDDEAEAVAAARRYLSFFQGRIAARQRRADRRALRHAAAREPPARLRRARRRRRARRSAARARAARRLRRRHRHRAGAHRGPPGRRPRQQPDASRRRDRRRRRRQGRALHAAVRRARPAAGLADRHAGLHGRPRDRERAARCATSAACSSSAAQLRVPVAGVVLRKAYGLGAMAMAAGGLHAPMATVAWPSGEFGAMGLEGAVELGYRKELEAARRRRRARGAVRAAGRRAVREGQGDQHGGDARDRRGHRPGRQPPLARSRRSTSARLPEPGGRFIDPW